MTGIAKSRIACAAVAFCLTLSATADVSVAQNSPASANRAPAGVLPAAPSTPSAAAPLIPPQPAAADQAGFLHQLKVWWNDSIAFVDQTMKDTGVKVADVGKRSSAATQGAAAAANDAAAATQSAMKDAVEATKGVAIGAADAMKSAVEATKNAATVLAKLPNTRFVGLHERCARAPNGAPDCEAAAAAGCRSQGFAGGHPVDVRTAKKCDTTTLQAGQTPSLHDCPVETVVTRAICQQ